MIEKQKAYLCIGGPYDGHRYIPKNNQNGFTVPKLSRMPQAFPKTPEQLMTPAQIEHIYYVAERIYCGSPDNEIWFWRPADQSIRETMEKLFERYEQSKNIIWNDSPFL